MDIIELNSNNFNKEVLEYDDKVLVDFNADWCGPCQMIRPILEEIAKDNNIKIGSVNVDDAEELASKYGVMSIPCLVLFHKGEEIGRSIGFKQKEELERFIGE